MDCDGSHDNSMSSRSSPSPPPRERCSGRFANQDHEDLFLHILQRLGCKAYSVLKKLTKEPEITSEEWEVDKLVDIVIDDGEWYLLKWKDWPASFASWERPNVHKLDPSLITEYQKSVAAKANGAPDILTASDSDAVEDGAGNNAASNASKKRTITSEELSDMARSLAKHISWPVFLRMMQRVDKEMSLGLFKKDEAILRKDLHLQHISVPCGLGDITQTLGISKGIVARKRLEWKLSQLENVFVQIVNDEDDELIPQLPNGFEYIVTNRYTAPDISPDILESLVGCSCRACVPGTRKCCSQQAGVSFAYRDDTPNTLIDFQRSQAIYECTSRCKCSPETCSNRVLQKGLTTPMQLFKTKGRGWGLKTLKPIKRGEFVIEYVGEVITSAQADEREGNQYLFDLDFNSEGDGQYTIDAMTLGNLSRFINSRCGDANLSSLAVYVDCQHPDLPRIGFFANRDIERMEELTFDYMMQGGSAGFESCLCGSIKCRGTINLQGAPVEMNNEPSEANTSAPRPKKTARARRRGHARKSNQQPAQSQPEETSGQDQQELPTSQVMLDMTDFSSPGLNGHSHLPLKPNAKDDVIAKNNTSAIDLVGSPSTVNGELGPFCHEDGDFTEEEDPTEVWHHARGDSNQPNDVISLSDSESPLKSYKSPMHQQVAHSPTSPLLQRQNADPAVDPATKASSTANIDLRSETESSMSSGEKEDQNTLAMDGVESTSAPMSNGEQALAN